MSSDRSDDRAALLTALDREIRQVSGLGVLFSQAVAEHPASSTAVLNHRFLGWIRDSAIREAEVVSKSGGTVPPPSGSIVPRLIPERTMSTFSQWYAPRATQSAGVPLTL